MSTTLADLGLSEILVSSQFKYGRGCQRFHLLSECLPVNEFNDYLSDAIALAYDSRAVIHSVIFLMLLPPALTNWLSTYPNASDGTRSGDHE